jgi:hypothetical protein
MIGRFMVLPDGRILDYWLTEPSLGWLVPSATLDTGHLISVIEANGSLATYGWGTPAIPHSKDAYTLRQLLQMGDISREGDTLFVLRNTTGVVELFSLSDTGRAPARQIPLHVYRRIPAPRETGTSVTKNGETKRSGTLTIDFVTTAFSVDHRRLYVISRLNTGTPQLPWPEEALVVYDHNGRILREATLRTRNSRAIRVSPGGTIVVLAHPDNDPAAEQVLNVLPPIFPDRAHACPWEPQSPSLSP